MDRIPSFPQARDRSENGSCNKLVGYMWKRAGNAILPGSLTIGPDTKDLQSLETADIQLYVYEKLTLYSGSRVNQQLINHVRK